MKIIKRLITLFISASLISLTYVGISTPASADGDYWLATHIDWNGISLGPNAGISQSLTPLAVPSPSQGLVEWALHVGNSTSTLSASIILQSTGIVVWQFMDVPLGSRVMGVDTAQCRLQSGNAFGTPNSARSICTTPLQAVAGETYNFNIKYWDNNGTKWWVALVTVQSTGQTIQLGRLENNASASVMATSMSMNGMNQTSFSKTPLPTCSAVPNHSITYGPIKSGGNNQPVFSGTRNSSACPTIANFDLRNVGVFKLNVGSENSASTGDSAKLRESRLLAEIPRPASVLVGLYGVNYVGYFNDDSSWIYVNPQIKSRQVFEVLPYFTDEPYSSLGTMTSMYSGYLIPDVSGEWKFRIRSDDASYLWLGNDAIVKYASSTFGAQLRNPGTHEPISKEFSINLVKDKVYPIRIYYGNGGSYGTFEFTLQPPGYAGFQKDTTGLFFHTEPGFCTNWGIEYALMGSLGYDNQVPPSQCGTPASVAKPGTVGGGASSGGTTTLIKGAASGSYYGALVRPSSGGTQTELLCKSGSVVSGIQVSRRSDRPFSQGFRFNCSPMSSDGTVGAVRETREIVNVSTSSTDYNNFSCPSGQAAISLDASTANYVQDVAITCAKPAPYSSGAQKILGAGPGLPINDASSCSSSTKNTAFVTGVNAYAAEGLDGIQAICTPFKFTSVSTSDTSASKKPSSPSFSLINVVGNKININVNLGSASSSRPDQVYLVAPRLGILDSNKLFGDISGSKASWSIDFDKLLSGTAIPLKVVGVKNGVESDAVEQNFNVPDTAKLTANKSTPAAPKNIKSRIVGTSSVITAEATVKVGALATSAYIFGTSLGVPASQAILGEVIGTKVLFEVPLKASMAGKTFPFTVYLANEAGKSEPVQSKLTVPAAPKIPSGAINIPSQTKAPKTIFCIKGSQTRTFAAKSCPPGWKNA